MTPTTVCFITGAARGFGRALALECAARIPGRVALVLLSRDPDGLAATRAAVSARVVTGGEASSAPAAHPPTPAPREVLVSTVLGDLSNLDALDAVWDSAELAAAALLGGTLPQSMLLFNNAGSLGEVCEASEMRDLAALRDAVNLNVTSTLWLAVRFSRWALGAGPRATALSSPPRHATIVNVSSLAAVKPLESLATYCAGKAARDMFHSVIAREQAGEGHAEPDRGSVTLRTLNYAPGPLETDMNRALLGSQKFHPPSKEYFRAMVDNGTILSPAASAARCVKLVLSGTFESGSHVDYYDLSD